MAEDKLDVTKIDVISLNKLLGKYVSITLKNGENKNGLIYTVDPVSENVIILYENEEKVSLSIVMKHSIENMMVLDQVPASLTQLDLNDMFKNRSPLHCDPERLKNTMKWMDTSMIPYTVKDSIILVEGVSIYPPYTASSCISENSVKLKGVQTLLSNMEI